MRTIIIIFLAAFSMTAYAQKSTVEKFIRKQAKTEGIKVQDIDIKSGDFTTQFQVEGEDIEKAMEQLEVIKILSCDSTSTAEKRLDFIIKAQNALQDEAYIELARIKSEEMEDVSLHANQMDNGLIREMIVLVKDDESVLMLYVKGKMDMTNLFSGKLFTSMVKSHKGKD